MTLYSSCRLFRWHAHNNINIISGHTTMEIRFLFITFAGRVPRVPRFSRLEYLPSFPPAITPMASASPVVAPYRRVFKFYSVGGTAEAVPFHNDPGGSHDMALTRRQSPR